MNEVMWREVMDSCNRDAPCWLDLTLAAPRAGKGGCMPHSPKALRSGGFGAWDAEVQWEELGCLRGARGALPGSLQHSWACHKPRMEHLHGEHQEIYSSLVSKGACAAQEVQRDAGVGKQQPDGLLGVALGLGSC